MDLKKILNNNFYVFLLLSLVILIFYSNIFQNGFAYDDTDFFINWETIKSLDNLPAIIAGDLPLSHQHGVYRPLRGIFQLLAYQLFTTGSFGYHLSAIIICALSAFFVFLIGKRLTNRMVGLMSGIIFAVLPVHVEAITFITASFDTIGILFILISFYLYLVFDKSKKINLYLLSIFSALLAIFTYEISMILPFLVILYELCFKKVEKNKIASSLKYSIAYFLPVIIYFSSKAFMTAKTFKGSFLTDIGFFPLIFTMSRAFVKYIYLTVFNFPLSVNHTFDISYSLGDSRVLLSFFFLISIVSLAIYLYKKNLKIFTFVIFWFFICLIPVSNLVRISRFITERYLYLASFAWALLLALIFYQLHQYFQKKKLDYTGAFILFFILVITVYGGMTFNRNKDWKNDQTLWQTTLAKEPEDTRSLHNLAFVYKKEGKIDKAIEYLNKALKQDPNYYQAYESLADICLDQEKYEEAIENLEKVIELKPNYFFAYNNLGFSYYILGDLKKAEENYQKALVINPSFYQANLNLGALYFEANRFNEAIESFEKAISTNRSNYEVFEALGMSYLGVNQKEKAMINFEKALKLNPEAERAGEFLKQL